MGSDLRQRHFGIPWARSLVVRGHFSLNPASGQARPCGVTDRLKDTTEDRRNGAI